MKLGEYLEKFKGMESWLLAVYLTNTSPEALPVSNRPTLGKMIDGQFVNAEDLTIGVDPDTVIIN